MCAAAATRNRFFDFDFPLSPPSLRPRGRSRRSLTGNTCNSLPGGGCVSWRPKIEPIALRHPPVEIDFSNSNFHLHPQRLRPRGRSRRSLTGNTYSSLQGDNCDSWQPKIDPIALRHPPVEIDFSNSNFHHHPQRLRPRGRSRRSLTGNTYSSLQGNNCDSWQPKIEPIALRHPPVEIDFSNSNFHLHPQRLRPRGRSRRSLTGNTYSSLQGDNCDSWQPKIEPIALRHPPVEIDFSNSNFHLHPQRLRPRGRSRRSLTGNTCSSL